MSSTLIGKPIQELVRSGQLAASTAAELAKVADPAMQAQLARAAVNGKLSRDAASGEVKRARRGVRSGPKSWTRKPKRAVIPSRIVCKSV